MLYDLSPLVQQAIEQWMAVGGFDSVEQLLLEALETLDVQQEWVNDLWDSVDDIEAGRGDR